MSHAPDRRFEVLAHVVEIANSSVDVVERLDSILGVINDYLGARMSVLFMQEHNRGKLVKSNTWPHGALAGRHLSQEFAQGRIGVVAQKREPQIFKVDKSTGDAAVDMICNQGELAALLPIMDDNRLYAVLLLVLPRGSLVDVDDQRLLQMAAREVAGTIRNFRLYFEAKRRIAELNVLSDLGRAAISTIEVEQLLTAVASICAKLMGVRGGLVQISSANGGQVKYQAVYGEVPPACQEEDALCGVECPAVVVSPEGQKINICRPGDLSEGFEQGVCAMLSFKGNYSGRLCVFDKVVHEEGSPGGFTAEDRNLMSSMSSMVSPALENALTFQRIEDLAQRNEEMVGALATLFEISTVLMTTVDFDETVEILLHAVIHPAGLDHDRVLLFLVHEDEGKLRPVADLAKPAQASQVRELRQSLLDIQKSEGGGAHILSDRLAGAEIDLDPDKSVIARTVAERRAILVEDPAADENVSPVIREILGPQPFVVVPMYAKGKVVGALLVNNASSRRAFGDREMKLLAMLANLGGLAVENSRLYQNLENANRELAQMRNRLLESDKLAALGEIAAGVAHEIRNPLVSIGGFTRRIRKKVGDESSITPYLDVIIEEVTRLERTLNEMLDFSTDARGHFEEHRLDLIMDQALELLARDLVDSRVKVVREYSSGLPNIFCDDRQIKHVFLNLYLNALQAMGVEGGDLRVRTFSITREGKQFVAGEVSDSGGGISMEVIHKIFNPFFTTKDSGSGLGLSIVHKIVTRHFGQVEVHNREGEGASFLVTLPAAEEARTYYLK